MIYLLEGLDLARISRSKVIHHFAHCGFLRIDLIIGFLVSIEIYLILDVGAMMRTFVGTYLLILIVDFHYFEKWLRLTRLCHFGVLNVYICFLILQELVVHWFIWIWITFFTVIRHFLLLLLQFIHFFLFQDWELNFLRVKYLLNFHFLVLILHFNLF